MQNSEQPKVPEKDRGVRLFASIGRFSIRFRWLILVFWIAAAVLIVHNLPSLTSVTQSNNTAFLPNSAPTEKALNLESTFEPKNVNSIPMVVATSDGTNLNDQDQLAIRNIELSLNEVNSVKQVVSQGQSMDGQAELLEIRDSSFNANGNPLDFIKTLRAAIAKVSVPNNLEVHLTGDLATQADSSSNSGKQNSDLQLGTVLFIIILLIVIFRAPLAPFVTLIPPLVVVTLAGPLIAEASKHGLKVSSLAQLLLTVLVLGAGTDYGLFLIFRVREELESGLTSSEAIVKSLSRVGESITFSAATVIAALLSLLAATFQIYSNLGIPLAIGVLLMLAAGLTLLPALLSIFGRAVFWPMKPQAYKTKRIGIWGKLSARIVQRPATVLIVGVLFFVALALFVPGYKAGGFGGTTSASSTSDSSKGTALLTEHFPSNSSNPTEVLFVLPKSIWQDPQVLLQAQNELSQAKEFKDITGPLDPNGIKISEDQLLALHSILGAPSKLPSILPASSGLSIYAFELYKTLANYISADGRTVQFSVGLVAGDPSTTKAMNTVIEQRSEVATIAKNIGATNSGIAGEASAFYDISSISNKDLLRVIPLAVIIIGVLLAILMRSLVAPLYLVASVVLSYLAALGLSVLIFMKLGNATGIVFILPFLMFIFLLALGEDYNILVMTRIKEEAHDLSLKKAVTEALNSTGTTVTSAGLVLAGTFGVLGVVSGGNQQVSEIGYGLALGILMDTFIVRTLIVPSIVVLLGRWNWWPSKHGGWIE